MLLFSNVCFRLGEIKDVSHVISNNWFLVVDRSVSIQVVLIIIMHLFVFLNRNPEPKNCVLVPRYRYISCQHQLAKIEYLVFQLEGST